MRVWDKNGHMPVPQRIITVLWLAFLMAGIATGVFFANIDPLELKYCVAFPELSRTAAYTVGFFLFWLLTASSSLLTVFFIYPSTADDAENSDRNKAG